MKKLDKMTIDIDKTTIDKDIVMAYYNIEGNVDATIKYIESFLPQYPKVMKYPMLRPIHNNQIHTSEEVEKYLANVKIYEFQVDQFLIAKEEYHKEERRIHSLIKDYLCDESGLTTLSASVNKDKIWHKAWQDGHSDGYYSVYQHLCELMELFN